jgi:hypothetical protein
VPDSIISSAASRVPVRTNSGETVLASAGKMYFSSHSFSARSSAGQDNLAAGVDPLGSTVARSNRIRAIDVDDVRTADGDRSGIQNLTRRVLGYDNPAGHDQRDLTARLLPKGENACGKNRNGGEEQPSRRSVQCTHEAEIV